MKTSTLLRLRNAALCSMATLALAACGGSGSGGGESAGDTNDGGATAPTASPLPLVKAATDIGDTVTAQGSVNILAPGDGEDSSGAADTSGDDNSDGGSSGYKTDAIAVLSSDGDDFDLSFENLDGMTLYVFDNDTVGTSNCNSTLCISTWPPLVADDNAVAAAPFTIVTRDDGLNQWALRGKPLYFFSGDAAPGDINGEGVGGVWHVAVNQPLLLNGLSVGAAEGDYFSAAGQTLVTAVETAGDNTAFVSEAQNLEGFSLYTFDVDDAGASNCFGGCLVNWPALLAETGETAVAPFSLIERQMDESGGVALQWAYHGKPLYFFAGDSSAGDTNGTAVTNWRLARPEPWAISDTNLGSALTASGLALVATPDGEVEATTSLAKDGFSLYTFDNDELGVSNCRGGCLSNWPALMANEGAEAQSPYSLIERNPGELQWALNGQPLYFFSGDAAAGDISGDGVGGVWHLARALPVVITDHEDEGDIFIAHGQLIDAEGNADDSFSDFTVYIFTDDTEGVSTCFDGCIDTWPPLFAEDDAQDFGDFTVITRDDPSTDSDDDAGIKQWAYQNQPLYFFVGDSSPGDVNGEYGTWFIARP